MSDLRGYLCSHFLGIVSVAAFLPTRAAYFRRLRPTRPSADIARYVQLLRRDGVVLIKDFLSRPRIDEFNTHIPLASQFHLSPEGDHSRFVPDAHKIVGLAPFFQDARLCRIARSSISGEAIPLRQTIGLKTVQGDIPSFERNFHMDTWKKRLKAFLFLHDINGSEAPLTYLRGSHKGVWRLWTEARIAKHYRVDDRGFAAEAERYFLGSFWPHEIRQLKNDYGYEELVCTGPAGSLLLFDGRGLHRATPLTGERRLILSSYWIHPGEHI